MCGRCATVGSWAARRTSIAEWRPCGRGCRVPAPDVAGARSNGSLSVDCRRPSGSAGILLTSCGLVRRGNPCQGSPSPGADSRAAPAGCPTQVGRVRQRGPFRSTCGTSLRKARLELETRNSRGRTARLPRRSGHDRAGSLKSGVSRLSGTAPAMRPPDRLGGRAARGPLPSGTPSTRIRGAGRRTRGPRIRPGGVAPPPGGP